jgi:sec-independent protein translocase protein TatA
MNLGVPELIIILLIVVLLFGARKLPDLARSLGRSIAEFKKGKAESEKALGDDKDEEKVSRDKKDDAAGR